jgi:isocitrate dehydrogenase
VGQLPQTLKAAKYKSKEETPPASKASTSTQVRAKKDLVGVDVFLDWIKGTADELGEAVTKLDGDGAKLALISNRGVKIWPGGHAETFRTDHWRCRFKSDTHGQELSHSQIISLLQRFADAGFDVIKTENLYNFDGNPGYSLAQGE